MPSETTTQEQDRPPGRRLDTPEAFMEGGGVLDILEKAPLKFKDRFEHFTWAWFALPMTTGAVSVLLAPDVQPYTFHGLDAIAKTLYILSIVFFLAVAAAMTYRFTRWRHTFRASLVHPTEGLYVATVWLYMSNFILGIAHFGIPAAGPWLIRTYEALFWIFFCCTFCSALGHYTLLYTLPSLRLEDMSPAWDMHIFPLLMTGTLAAQGAPHLPPDRAVPMLVCGLTSQGLGFLASLFMNANYTRRMIQWGFPNPKTRPAMFVAVGPPSFTAIGVLGMADAFPEGYIDFSAGGGPDVTLQVMNVLAACTAVFVWFLGFWFFCVAVMAISCAWKERTFSLNWWSFIFPTSGLVTAIVMIGDAFESKATKWVGSVLTVLLVVGYIAVGVKVALAVMNKDVMWPGKDEDTYQHERKAKSLMRDLEMQKPVQDRKEERS